MLSAWSDLEVSLSTHRIGPYFLARTIGLDLESKRLEKNSNLNPVPNPNANPNLNERLPPQVTAEWRPGDNGGPLELLVSTNNDAVIVSVVIVDPEGGLFGGEVRATFVFINRILDSSERFTHCVAFLLYLMFTIRSDNVQRHELQR